MNTIKQFPIGLYQVGKIGEVTRILDAKGRDVMTLPGGPERLVECCNALKAVFFPEAHVAETERYVERLKLAIRAQGGNWNFDISQAPKGRVESVATGKFGSDGSPIFREVHVSPRIIAAGNGGAVTLTKWLTESERWEMFTKEVPPFAWMPWPTHPSLLADGGANIVSRHENIAGQEAA